MNIIAGIISIILIVIILQDSVETIILPRRVSRREVYHGASRTGSPPRQQLDQPDRAALGSRRGARMPELADALEEAGCENREILDHCRSTGEHVRGCWVVDLILGKE